MVENNIRLIKPKYLPPLDKGFRPAVLANSAFRKAIAKNAVPLVLGLEREEGKVSRHKIEVTLENHPCKKACQQYVERIVKFLLWQRGGHKLFVGGPSYIGDYLRKCYAKGGKGEFDSSFMGNLVYQKPFKVISCKLLEVPPESEIGISRGGSLEGFRIGFDLGATDRKVCAIKNGEVIYSEEVAWEPKINEDPNYHYQEILDALKTAASKLPRVDAIGGSSAGIYINNRPMVASLFRGVPEDRYEEVRNLFLRIQEELGIPIEVINDGDVTALAGAMSLKDSGVLGLAMGSSEAAGFVDRNGHILGWLNELAFAPIDYSHDAPIDEWSKDRGCGSMYFSQQCVFRLAPKVGISIPSNLHDAEKLKFVQEELEGGNEAVADIWKSIGIYLGYALAHYADFYDFDHILILGRCTSGKGGGLIIQSAKRVIEDEFPEIARKITIQIPDERSRLVGQAIAAASLPRMKGNNDDQIQ